MCYKARWQQEQLSLAGRPCVTNVYFSVLYDFRYTKIYITVCEGCTNCRLKTATGINLLSCGR